MNIIFEPHGDDALLSLFIFFKNTTDNYLYTVFNSRSSIELIESFNLKGYTYLALPDNTYEREMEIINFKIFKELFKNVHHEELFLKYYEYALDAFEKAYVNFNKNFEIVDNHILEILKNNSDATFYFPTGLKHPDHFTLFRIGLKYYDDYNIYFYSDVPNNSSKYKENILLSALELYKEFETTKELSDAKMELCAKVYPTEEFLFSRGWRSICFNVNENIYKKYNIKFKRLM